MGAPIDAHQQIAEVTIDCMSSGLEAHSSALVIVGASQHEQGWEDWNMLFAAEALGNKDLKR
jgi:hypothetical protein